MKASSELARISGWHLVAITAAGLWTCVYPTERSGDLTVVMDSIANLIDNETDSITARVVDGAGNVIEDIPVEFTSSNPSVLSVIDEMLIASSPGEAEITATALGYEGANPAIQLVRVRDEVEIDSVTPRLVRFGQTVRVYGVGLGPKTAVAYLLENATAPFHSWLPEDPQRPERFGVLSLYVAPPARQTVHAVVVTANGTAQSPDSAFVVPQDIYEPNETSPWDFGEVDRMDNPALAFEARPRNDIAVDWYRFTQASVGDRTVRIGSEQVTTLVYRPILTDSVSWDPGSSSFVFGPDAWAIGQGFLMCAGVPLNNIDFLPGSLFRVALEDLEPGTYDLINGYVLPAGYAMGIRDSYESSRLRDSAEENDMCHRAAPLELNDRRLLTIDNPFDPDWFSFSVDVTTTVNFGIEILAGGGGFIQPDLDIYLLQNFVDSLALVAANVTDDATNAAAATIAPGDYYLLITDFAGVPAAYALNTNSSPAPPDAVPTPPSAMHRATGFVQVPPPPRAGSSR